jgi:hypothetical protein
MSFIAFFYLFVSSPFPSSKKYKNEQIWKKENNYIEMSRCLKRLI